jgi:hypothetical protein
MGTQNRLTGIALCLLSAVTAYATPLKVDIGQQDTAGTQSGWIGWSEPSQVSRVTRTTTLSADFDPSFTAEVGICDWRQRGNKPSGDYPLVLWDAVKSSSAFNLTFTDLKAGLYQITTFHHDGNTSDAKPTINITVSDALSSGRRVIEGLQQTWGPVGQTPATATFTFTSDGVGSVVIRLVDNNNASNSSWNEAFLNGFILDSLNRRANTPIPVYQSIVSTSLAQISWTNPEPNKPGNVFKSDVYFGSIEPDDQLPNYGLPRIASQITDTYVILPAALEQFKTYYWVVNCTELEPGEEPVVLPGDLWQFNANNGVPQVDAGHQQYLWLNNAGDPATATVVLDGTVTDDGLPSGQLDILWTQISGPITVPIDPANVADITLVLPAVGNYVFQLSGFDGDTTTTDTVQINVYATPCLAAQGTPGYQAPLGDFNDDCWVNLEDFAVFAANWLKCTSLAPCQ